MTMISRSPNALPRLFSLLGVGALLVLGAGATLFHQQLFSLLSSIPAVLTQTVPETYKTLPKNVLAARLADREQELARVRYQTLLYGTVVEENKRLARLLELPEEMSFAVGRVIARPPRTHYDTLLVELKEGHDVRVGNFVSFGEVLLGVVEKVGNRTVSVTLYSSGGMSVDARVGEPSGIVVLKGLGGGAFVFEIPQSVAVKSGDVLTAAHDSTRALALVESIVSDPDTTLSTVYARLPSALPDIRYVTFVRGIEETL